MMQMGRTPLMEASYYGHTEVMQLLINAGADTEQMDEVTHWSGGVEFLLYSHACRIKECDR